MILLIFRFLPASVPLLVQIKILLFLGLRNREGAFLLLHAAKAFVLFLPMFLLVLSLFPRRVTQRSHWHELEFALVSLLP